MLFFVVRTSALPPAPKKTCPTSKSRKNGIILLFQKNYSIFAVLTDNGYTHFAGQAVKLLTLKVGIFVAQLQNIGDCLLRKIIKALVVETISVSSAKWQSLFPMPTTYLINAYRYE